MSCVLRRKRHSSGKSPVAHLIVRMSSRPKQASPLSSSCEERRWRPNVPASSPSWTWSAHGRQLDVRERRETCSAAALLPHRAPCRFVPSTTPSNPRRLDTFRSSGIESQCPELRGMRAVIQFLRQSAEPCVAPPTSPFTALLMDPRAVKAQARFPRCSSVCREAASLVFSTAKRTRVLLGPASDNGSGKAKPMTWGPLMAPSRALCPLRATLSRDKAVRGVPSRRHGSSTEFGLFMRRRCPESW